MKIPTSIVRPAVFAFALAASCGAQAQPAAPAAATPSAAAAEMTDAEVRKVDRETQKLTLKHGDIKNLDMPGMTMLFRVSDPAMLDRVKPGDKVKFRAEKTGGAFVITELKVAP